MLGDSSRHSTRARRRRFVASIVAIVFALSQVAVSPTPARAQQDDEAAHAIGRFFGNLTRKSFDDRVWKSWLRVEPRVLVCMYFTYQVTPMLLAQRGVSATNDSIKPYVEGCAEHAASMSLEDRQEDEALVQRMVAPWTAEIQAHLGETRQRLGQDAQVAVGATVGAVVDIGVQAYQEDRARRQEQAQRAQWEAEQEKLNQAQIDESTQMQRQNAADYAAYRAQLDREDAAYQAQLAKSQAEYSPPTSYSTPEPYPPSPSYAFNSETVAPLPGLPVAASAPVPPPQPETPAPMSRDASAVLEPAPAPSPGGRQYVSAGEPFTFVENYTGDVIGSVSVYQHGDLITTSSDLKQVAGGYGYQSGASGTYSANGSNATNVMTTTASLSSVATMPATTAGLAPLLVSTPYSPPPPPSAIDPQYGTGGRLPSVSNPSLPVQAASTNGGYTFLPTVNNTFPR